MAGWDSLRPLGKPRGRLVSAAHLAAILTTWTTEEESQLVRSPVAAEDEVPARAAQRGTGGTPTLVNRTGTAPTVAMTTSPAGGHLAAAVSQTASPEISLPSVRTELTPKVTPNAPTSAPGPKSRRNHDESTDRPSLGVPA